MAIAYSYREKMAGLFLLIGLILIFVAAILVGGGRDWFRSYYTYYALYNEGYGLSPGVKVKFLRTDVGLVTRLELTDNDKVKVHMSILAEYAGRIKSDSVAVVGSPTFIGSEYIDIIPGSTYTAQVPKGGQIPAKERKTIEDIFKDLRLDTMIKRVEAIMINVDNLTHQLQDPTGPLLGTMTNVRKLTASVSEGEGTLGQLTMNQQAYDELMSIVKDLQTAANNIAAISHEFSQTAPAISSRLETITSQIEMATRTAPDIGRGARESVRSVNQILESIKGNFLIRGNLPQDPEPESQTFPVR
ncbi:MAG: MlaD family protein [Candidatus Adiutrix sp.]